jgi:hypothetical protein
MGQQSFNFLGLNKSPSTAYRYGHGNSKDNPDAYDDNDPFAKNGEDTLIDVLSPMRWNRNQLLYARLQNWERIEPLMAKLSLGEPVPPCNCHEYNIEVRVISPEDYTIETIPFRRCGLRCARLISRGLFPSTPVNPKTVFPINPIDLLWRVVRWGSCSKYAFAEGLRETLENKMHAEVPRFDRAIIDAYKRFVSTSYLRDNIFTAKLDEMDHGSLVKVGHSDERLANLCTLF